MVKKAPDKTPAAGWLRGLGELLSSSGAWRAVSLPAPAALELGGEIEALMVLERRDSRDRWHAELHHLGATMLWGGRKRWGEASAAWPHTGWALWQLGCARQPVVCSGC